MPEKKFEHINRVLRAIEKRLLIYWQEKHTGEINFKILFNQGGIMRCRELTDKEIIIE